MKHVKKSLVVLASVLAVAGVLSVLKPSTKGMSGDVPKSAFSSRNSVGLPLSGRDPEGTSYAITSFTVANDLDASAAVTLRGVWGETSDCIIFPTAPQITNGPVVWVQPGETVHLSFPQPYVFSARPGATACLSTAGSAVEVVSVVGFRF